MGLIQKKHYYLLCFTSIYNINRAVSAGGTDGPDELARLTGIMNEYNSKGHNAWIEEIHETIETEIIAGQ